MAQYSRTFAFQLKIDQIPNREQSSIGLGILRLVFESKNQAGELARNLLISRTKQEFKDNKAQKQLPPN